MNTALTLVSASERKETVAERVRRLQGEARQLAHDHVLALTAAMTDANRLAAEIAEGGEAYPAGIRDLARRFAEDCESRVQSIEAINNRVSALG
jgi:hypothetical protein